MYAPKKLLLTRIEWARKELIEVAGERGFTSKESLLISQELDELLNAYNCVRGITFQAKEVKPTYEYNEVVI